MTKVTDQPTTADWAKLAASVARMPMAWFVLRNEGSRTVRIQSRSGTDRLDARWLSAANAELFSIPENLSAAAFREHPKFYWPLLLRSNRGAVVGAMCLADHRARKLSPCTIECLLQLGQQWLCSMGIESASENEFYDEGQKQLKALAEVVPHILWTIDPLGKMTYLNSRGRAYFEFDRPDTTGWQWSDYLHPEDAERVIALRSSCLVSGEAYELPARLRSAANGEFRWHLVRSVSVKDAGGAIEKWIGTATDIHDQKSALHEMQAVRQRTETVMQNAPITLWSVDLNGIFTFYDGSAYRAMGITPAERLGKSVFTLEAQIPGVDQCVRSAMNGESVDKELCVDGHLWYQCHFDPVFDAQAKVCGVVGLSIDITDRKAQKKATVLRQSEARLRAILDSAPEAVLTLDLQGMITDWNPMAEEMFGWSREEAIGQSIFTLVIPDGLEKYRSPVGGVAIQPVRAWEVAARRRSGLSLQVQVSISQLSFGERELYTAFISDITERKSQELRLISKQAQLSEAQEIAQLGNWEWDVARDYIFWSDELFRIHGVSPGSFSPTQDVICQYLHPEDLQSFNNAVRRCYYEKTPYSLDYRIVLADGSERILMGSGRAVSDESGKVVKLFGVCQDITERKKTTDALRALIYASPLAIVVLTVQGKVERWNPAAEKIFGWTEAEVVGGPLPYVTSDNRAESSEIIRRVVQGEAVINRELTRQTKSGTDIGISLSVVPLLDSRGEAYGIMAVVTDITAQKGSERELIRARELADASVRVKSEFLANMSHEIRTPLNGVIGVAGILAESPLNAEQKSYVGTIESSANNLLNLINDILDFSKIEAGKLELEMLNFDLPHLMQDIERMLSFSAKQKGIALVTDVAPALRSETFKSDPGRLRQILANLVSNAVKFTAQGRVTLRVMTTEILGASRALRFEVVDTGIGIPEKSLHRMFQAFSQADASTTRKFGGTGLGLSISKQLVRMLGGQIGVESVDGQGSTFWFTIPVELGVAQVSSIQLPAPIKAVKVGDRRLRILLAEDNAVNQLVATKMLEKAGYHVDSVANGRECVNALRSIPYDLVLMDCQMPELDGYEATKLIRAGEVPNVRDLPVIAMTANAMLGDRERCLAAGMNDYVTKPVKAADLLRAIERVMSALVKVA